MLSLVYKIDDNAIDSLLKKKFYISQSYGAGCVPQHNYFLAHAGVDVVNKILLESEHLGTNQKERLDNLAKTLQALYPEGKKAGTNNYWRGNVPEIRDRLQMFLKRFDDYPDEVVDWDNLLPSCKRCNTTKGTHDVVTEPIINPFDIDPKILPRFHHSGRANHLWLA